MAYRVYQIGDVVNGWAVLTRPAGRAGHALVGCPRCNRVLSRQVSALRTKKWCGYCTQDIREASQIIPYRRPNPPGNLRDLPIVDQIHKLRAAGHSNAEIAKVTGFAVDDVSALGREKTLTGS